MFTADKIDDCGVWLGDFTALKNRQALDERQISHIVTILDYQPSGLDPNRKYLFVPAEDVQSTDLLSREFETCFQFIDQAIQQGQQVLIHCQQGISRSATITAMYLMRKYALTREQALERLRSKRRYCMVAPNAGFLRQLELFHQMNYKVDVENELYKEFRRKLFAPIQSNTSVDRQHLPVLLPTDDPEREYKCKTCHCKLFTGSDIERHDLACENSSRIYTFFLDWIDQIFLEPVGLICCPNCKASVGEYSLHGLRCTCNQWIQPAFAFQCQSVE